jgi:choline kinase
LSYTLASHSQTQIIVVDFEYASPNPAAFDIANHFHEWTANYHSATPHLLNESIYPTPEERKTFYAAYLTHATSPTSPLTPNSPPTPMVSVPYDATADEPSTLALERHVRVWSPASHAMWAIWGLVQARESVESREEQEEVSPDFDYVGYADGRMSAFRREIELLGVRALINR